MNRRNFLATSAAFTGSMLVLAGNHQASATPSQRKSIVSMPSDAPDITSYQRAVSIMQNKLSANDKRNWNRQAEIHAQWCPHTNWWFLPWHRVYLHYFEQICRDVLQDADFALPYWDWTRYPYLPDIFLEESSPLWHADRNLGASAAIPLGSIWKPEINRIVMAQDLGQVFSGKTASDVQRAPSIPSEFEDVPHGAVHTAVGGDMLTALSPSDPIFWLHHCNVDRLWESWAVLHNWAIPSEKLWSDHQLSQFYDPVSNQPVTVKCEQTINSALFGAKYDRLEVFAGPPLPVRQIMFGPGEEIAVPPDIKIHKIEFLQNDAKVAQNKTIFELNIPPDLDPLLEHVPPALSVDARPRSTSVYLLVHGVTVPNVRSTMMRVFVNVTDPSVSTPINDPGLVATASFFGNFDHHGEAKKADFAFNISANIARLIAAGRKVPGKLNVTLFSIDPLNPGGGRIPEPSVPAKLRIIVLE